MPKFNRLAFACLLLAFILLPACGTTAQDAAAQDTLVKSQGEVPDNVVLMNLWPGDPPGKPTFDGDPPPTSRRDGRALQFVHVPTLELWPAPEDKRNGAAVVVCPGGGYRVLADGHEGTDIARWLNDNGITAIILRYRMHPYRHPVPMHDVQRALRTARANAKKWSIDPERIGVLGFSAGGHLASTAVTHFAAAHEDAEDPVERVSSRPNFGVLVYPVISLRIPTTHKGSRHNLLGPEPDGALVALMSNDEQVNEKTPPTFLVHSKDDKAVPIKNSELFLAALKKHGVPGRLTVFETGGHGYGLGRSAEHETSAWPAQCIAWLGEQGLLSGEGDE